MADRVGQLERQLRTVLSVLQGGSTSQIPVVDALPVAGRQGRLLMVASTSEIWKDDGVAWVLV